MDSPSSVSTPLRRLLVILLIASALSVLSGIIISSIVFRIGGLEREEPFRTLYVGKKGGIWKPISQYMLCTSIQWLMEVQGRTVEHRLIRPLEKNSTSELEGARKLDEQARQLEEKGDTAEAQNLRIQAEQARNRSEYVKSQGERISGPWRQLIVKDKPTWRGRYYITRYYSLIVIPILALWIAIWIVAAYYVPREVRGTNEIVKIGAVVGLFHGMILGLLVILWSLLGVVKSQLPGGVESLPILGWWLGGQSLQEFYSEGSFYHGQWTGLWLFPVCGVILTGYLFGTLAGWLVKGIERLRCAVFGGLTTESSKSSRA